MQSPFVTAAGNPRSSTCEASPPTLYVIRSTRYVSLISTLYSLLSRLFWIVFSFFIQKPYQTQKSCDPPRHSAFPASGRRSAAAGRQSAFGIQRLSFAIRLRSYFVFRHSSVVRRPLTSHQSRLSILYSPPSSN